MDYYIEQQVVDISTADDLHRIREDMYGVYRLTADIDLSDIEYTPIGTPTSPFHGILDGNGYSIKNLNIHSPNQSHVGLFSRNAGVIINLTIENSNITGRDNAGVIAGQNLGSIIDSSALNIARLAGGSSTGGLAGSNTGTITGSHSSGDAFTGIDHVGGLVGFNTGTIQKSYSTINVRGRNNVGRQMLITSKTQTKSMTMELPKGRPFWSPCISEPERMGALFICNCTLDLSKNCLMLLYLSLTATISTAMMQKDVD